jgi:hypothetical protein
LSRFPGLLWSWCYAQSQTCTNCGYPNSALAYVQPGGTWPACRTSWTTNAPRETSTHLNRCPDNGQTLLFKESITNLSTLMHQHNCTNPELTYWIEKYLLFRGTRSFTSLVDEGGFCSNDLRLAAAGQDLIGWTEFLHGKVLVEFASIQHIHCTLSPSCRLTWDN